MTPVCSGVWRGCSKPRGSGQGRTPPAAATTNRRLTTLIHRPVPRVPCGFHRPIIQYFNYLKDGREKDPLTVKQVKVELHPKIAALTNLARRWDDDMRRLEDRRAMMTPEQR
jgi:hypothetical protein